MTNNGVICYTWRVIRLDKGLKVNAGKSKVMVGSGGKEVQANSVKSIGYKKWTHNQCSDVCGGLSLVVDGVSVVMIQPMNPI